MTDPYYVIGNPIEHSKSPEIHALFARQTKQDIRYGKHQAPIDDFDTTVCALIASGMRGANVTVPFKQRAFAFCHSLSQYAQRAGAVNTLLIDDCGRCHGDNTDGVGMLTDLTANHSVDLSGQRILLLGAGGAVRGVLQPLLEQRPAQIVIANRNADKASALADDFGDQGPIVGGGLDCVQNQCFDLIINGTSAGLQGQALPIAYSTLRPGGVTYDMLYADQPTPFVLWGRRARASQALDGLGMLVEQAARSFHLWRGVRPDTERVLAHFRGIRRLP